MTYNSIDSDGIRSMILDLGGQSWEWKSLAQLLIAFHLARIAECMARQEQKNTDPLLPPELVKELVAAVEGSLFSQSDFQVSEAMKKVKEAIE